MKSSDFTIRDGFETHTYLDKEYNKFIYKTIRELSDSDENKWIIYKLILKDLVDLKLISFIKEFKYRLTDKEDPNLIMLDIIKRDKFESSMFWYYQCKLDYFLEYEFSKQFY